MRRSRLSQYKQNKLIELFVAGVGHLRINHSTHFAERQNHINGIENFWNQAKRVLHKYNGIDRKSFPLSLKECEFRFNFGNRPNSLKFCGIGMEFRLIYVSP